MNGGAVPEVPVGPYTITAETSGFTLDAQSGIGLASGRKMDLTFVLDLGATTEAI